jgi:AAA15 family ATPase/GTPase
VRLTRLSIQNFRAIANLLIEDLTDAVVLAGPNGCGKSCVLDAIRLLKSAYGSYEQDEWQTWFGEFQIDLNREPRELLDLFQKPTLPLQITGTFTLSNEEQTFLSDNAVSLLEAKLWRELNPNARANSRQALSLGATQRATNVWIEETINKSLPEIRKGLDASTHEASLTIQPFGTLIEPPTIYWN